MTSSSASAWDPPVSVRKEKKQKEGAGCFRGLELGCQTRARAEERKWLGGLGGSGSWGCGLSYFFPTKLFLLFSKQQNKQLLNHNSN